MSVSVLAPFSPAMERTSQVLFRPFDLAKWVVLGFCAWLAQFGDGGGVGVPKTQLNFGMPFPGPGPGGVAPPPGGPRAPQAQGQAQFDALLRSARDWVQAHAAEVIGVAAAVVLVGLALGLVFLWLKARGVFLFLDGVVRDRASVAEPWREYAAEGNSLFRFLVAFAVVMTLIALLILAAGVAIALPDIRAWTFGTRAVAAIFATVLLFVLNSMVVLVVQVFLYDFVVPIMYVRRCRVTDAWGEFRRSVLSGRAGTMFLYLLFKVVLGLGAAVVAVTITCATCCLAALPFVGTVLLLPVSVFLRAYPLYFLEQIGPEWSIFRGAGKPGGLIFEDLPPPRPELHWEAE